MSELRNTTKLAWITEGEIVYTVHTYRSGLLAEGILQAHASEICMLLDHMGW